jgi:hypothetical protein
MSETNIWPQIDEALRQPGVVHKTPKHGRITVDIGLQDGHITWATLRRIDAASGRPLTQVDPALPIATAAGDKADDALRWFLPELVQKAREVLREQ